MADHNIETFDDLTKIGVESGWLLSDRYILANDIDGNGTTITPIGSNTDPFCGIFDGSNYKIYNFKIISDGVFTSLFYATSDNSSTKAQIKNLILENVYVDNTNTNDTTGDDFYASSVLVGYCSNTIISDCAIVDCTIKADNTNISFAAPLVSLLSDSTIENTYTKNCEVSAIHTSAFITYSDGENSISKCFALANNLKSFTDISGTSIFSGFIYAAGSDTTNGLIVTDCYSTSVFSLKNLLESNTEDVYLSGFIIGSNNTSLTNVYASFLVADKTISGSKISKAGLLSIGTADCTHSYWDMSITDTTNSVCGIGKTTEELKDQTTFENWDFDNIWSITNNKTYPYLKDYQVSVKVPNTKEQNSFFIKNLLTEYLICYNETYTFLYDKENIVVAQSIDAGSTVIISDSSNILDITTAVPKYISSYEELVRIGVDSDYDTNFYYKLTNDIDASGNSVFLCRTPNTKFSGIFDGNNHIIYNVVNDATGDRNPLGLFGYTDSSAVIRNLYLLNINQLGKFNTGLLVGNAYKTTIKECFAFGNIMLTNDNTNCYVGGLVGVAQGDCTIQNCNVNLYFSNSNRVSDNFTFSGLVGYFKSSGNRLENSFCQFIVDNTRKCYGLLTSDTYVDVTNCYWNKEISNVTNSGYQYVDNSYGKTTDDLTNQSTFTNWDFTNIWTIKPNLPPHLKNLTKTSIPNITGNNKVLAKKVLTACYLKEGNVTEKYNFIVPKDYVVSQEAIDTIVDIDTTVDYTISKGRKSVIIESEDDLKKIGIDDDYPLDGGIYSLVKNIDMTTFLENSIGNANTPFRGIFDGNNYKIRNIRISKTPTNTDYNGLFGYVDKDSTICRLHLTDCSYHIINNNSSYSLYTGSLIGYCNGTVYNCSVTGNILVDKSSGYCYTGGLIGKLGSYGSIRDCFSFTNVTGDRSSNSTSYVGGLIGYIDQSSFVFNCYSKGLVTGANNSGGLIGGGISNSSVINSYWDINTSNQSTSFAGTGKTTAQMKQKNTYVNWDFDNIWYISENKYYPILRGMKVIVSNFIGLSKEDAIRSISDNFLSLGILGERYSDIYSDNTVAYQRPSVGTEVPVSYTINILVSKGSANNVDPLSISTIEELQLITHDPENIYAPNKNYVLANDIDASDTKNWTSSEYDITGFIPISYPLSEDNEFSGIFDGSNYVIKNLYIYSFKDNIALFSCINEDATIKNLGLVNISLTSKNNIAGLAWKNKGKIESVYLYGSIISYDPYYNKTGSNYAFVLDNSGNIENCYTICRLNVPTWYNSSGFVCNNYSDSSIINCYSIPLFETSYGASNLFGFCVNAEPGSIISSSYWNVTLSKVVNSSGGDGKTTGELKNQSTFTNWDFNNIWSISGDESNKSYPYLKNQSLLTVPNVINLEKEEGRNLLINYGFSDITENYQYSNDVTEQIIYSIDPEVDTTDLKPGTPIIIDIYKPYIVVPNLIGKSLSDATDVLKEKLLNVGEIVYQYHSDFSKDFVFDQSPKSGDKVEEGTPVDITVSSGKGIIVPNFIGLTESECDEIAQSNNIILVKNRSFNAAIPDGTCFDQTPNSDTTIPADDATVFIRISLGASFIMPNLIGMKYEDATKLLKSSSSVKIIEKLQTNNTVPEGYVFDQTPAPNSTTSISGNVTIIVSAGSTVIVPDLTERTLEYAKDVITKNRLRIGKINYVCTTVLAKGLVIEQSPNWLDCVDPYTEVDLLVSSGPCKFLPDVVGLDYTSAINTLKRSGFSNILLLDICVDYLDELAEKEDMIVGQEPEGDFVYEENTEIILYKYVDPPCIQIRDFRGLTEQGAKEILNDYKSKLKDFYSLQDDPKLSFKINYVFVEDATIDKVISQLPEPNSYVGKDSIIYLTIESSYIPITTAEDIKEKLGKHSKYGFSTFKIIGTIDAKDSSNWNDGKGYIPDSSAFYGILESDENASITNLSIGSPSESASATGLFSSIDKNSRIEGITLVNVIVNSSVSNTGVIAGINNGVIRECRVLDSIINCSGNFCGGLVGKNRSIIDSCEFSGIIKANQYVGGICGINEITDDDSTVLVQECDVVLFTPSTLTDTTSIIPSVISAVYCVGGICGINGVKIENNTGTLISDISSLTKEVKHKENHKSLIKNCTSLSIVNGRDIVGGIVGQNNYKGKIELCKVCPKISGYSYIGGIVGINYDTILGCSSIDTYNFDNTTVKKEEVVSYIDGVSIIGGICGSNQGGTISQCEVLVDRISSKVTAVGGLVGESADAVYTFGSIDSNEDNIIKLDSIIEFSFVRSSYIKGSVYVGGLVGVLSHDATGSNLPSGCYVSAIISGHSFVGSAIGFYGSSEIQIPSTSYAVFINTEVCGSYNFINNQFGQNTKSDNFMGVSTNDLLCNTEVIDSKWNSDNIKDKWLISKGSYPEISMIRQNDCNFLK